MKTPSYPRFAAVLLALLPWVGACAPQVKTGPVEVYLHNPNPTLTDLVRALEGKSARQRRKALERILRSKNIEYKVEGYRTAGEIGANLVFGLGSGGKELIVSAHYDAVVGSPGANDDASCISSLLDVHERLRAHELRSLTVTFILFDDEESGMKGSDAYVRTHALDGVIAMYSLELCGIGNTVAIWDLKDKDRERLGIRTLIQTVKEMRTHHVVEGKIPRHSSDHKKFAESGIPAVAVTIVPKKDEALLREYIFQPNLPKWADRKNRPYIFQLYHTPDDKADSLQEDAMKLMSDTIYETVINLNRRLSESTATGPATAQRLAGTTPVEASLFHPP